MVSTIRVVSLSLGQAHICSWRPWFLFIFLPESTKPGLYYSCSIQIQICQHCEYGNIWFVPIIFWDTDFWLSLAVSSNHQNKKIKNKINFEVFYLHVMNVNIWSSLFEISYKKKWTFFTILQFSEMHLYYLLCKPGFVPPPPQKKRRKKSWSSSHEKSSSSHEQI